MQKRQRDAFKSRIALSFEMDSYCALRRARQELECVAPQLKGGIAIAVSIPDLTLRFRPRVAEYGIQPPHGS